MKPMDLFERYVHEVGQHLPRKSREDIQLELLSLLQDALDERADAAGKEPNVRMAADVLYEFGKPETMAAEYRPTQYLIGPNLFPIYKIVVTVVLAVLAGVHALPILLNILRGQIDNDIIGMLWGLLTSYWNIALTNVGLITLIFVAIERFVDLPEEQEESTEWDPLALPAIENPDRINRFEMIAGIVGGVIMIALINTYSTWPAIEGFPELLQLAPEFISQIPWLTAAFALDIMLKTVVAWQGRWQIWSRLADIGQEMFGLYVLYRIIQGPVTVFETVSGVSFLTKFVLGIIMVIVAFEVIGKLYRVLVGKSIIDFDSLKGRFA